MTTYRIFAIVRGKGKIYWNAILNQWTIYPGNATPFMKEEKAEREFLPFGAEWEETE